MYKLTLSKPIDGIEVIEFPRLTWANYKRMMNAVQVASLEDGFSTTKAVATAFLKFGKPALPDESIDKLSLSDMKQIESLYSHMEMRTGEWSGGQFKLSTPIPVALVDGEASLTGFTFKAQTVGDAWDYLDEKDTLRQYEIFIRSFGRHVGDNEGVKALPFNAIWLDMMDAKDVLFIGRNIAGKSEGGSASWERL